jgi:hypothetical protein
MEIVGWSMSHTQNELLCQLFNKNQLAIGEGWIGWRLPTKSSKNLLANPTYFSTHKAVNLSKKKGENSSTEFMPRCQPIQ